MPNKVNLRHKRKWQVWRTDVHFKQDPNQSKKRPFLISEIHRGYVYGHEMTSKKWQYDKNPDHFYEVKNKKKAGLTDHSYVNFDKTVASKLSMKEYMGSLDPKDIRSFNAKKKRYYKK